MCSGPRAMSANKAFFWKKSRDATNGLSRASPPCTEVAILAPRLLLLSGRVTSLGSHQALYPEPSTQLHIHPH